MGVGIHGEPGRRRVKLTKAVDTVEQMISES
jgi:dihydroxyacetone kinase